MKVECAAIMAGGQSSRMGRDKALIDWQGKPLVAHIAAVLSPIFPQICVVTANPVIAAAADLPAMADQFEQRGPLAGIHAALSHFQAPTFVVACDMPYLNAAFIQYLSENFEGDATVPLNDGGFEPLCAAYSPTCLPVFANSLAIEGKMPSLRYLLSTLDTRYVPVETVRQFDPTLNSFSNWNTPEDLPKTLSG